MSRSPRGEMVIADTGWQQTVYRCIKAPRGRLVKVHGVYLPGSVWRWHITFHANVRDERGAMVAYGKSRWRWWALFKAGRLARVAAAAVPA